MRKIKKDKIDIITEKGLKKLDAVYKLQTIQIKRKYKKETDYLPEAKIDNYLKFS